MSRTDKNTETESKFWFFSGWAKLENFYWNEGTILNMDSDGCMTL